MKSEKQKLGDMPRTLPAYRLLASVGIGTLIRSETLFNEADSINPRTLLEISNELYIYSAVLASFCTQYQGALERLIVELPDDVGAVVVENPFYEPKTKESSRKGNDSIRAATDDYPF